MNTTLKGFYRLIISQPNQTPRIDTGWFENLVLDSGLNRIGSGVWASHCQVGTDNTPPQPTNTSLLGLFASTTTVAESSSGAQGSAPYYGYLRRKYTFAQGTFNNTNLAEVGIGWDAGLFSRALIADINGNPTTITILSNEQLDVIYEIRLYPPLTDTITTYEFEGQTYTYTARAAVVASGSSSAGWGMTGDVISISSAGTTYAPVAYDGAIGAITSTPSGNTSTRTSNSTAAYGNNNLYRDMSATWGTDKANFALGVKSVLLYTNGMGAFQMQIDPPLTKTSIDSLVMNFRVSWSRA